MIKMASLVLGSAVALVVLAGGGSPASAEPVYPWCAHYGGTDIGGAINCGFSTRGQCMAAVSGVGGTCQMNVNLLPSAAQPLPSKRQSSSLQ